MLDVLYFDSPIEMNLKMRRDKMALTNEDLKAISQLLDEKLDEKLDKRLAPINERLAVIEYKQDRTTKKLEDLRLDIAVSERDIKRDIFEFKDQMETVIEILKQNELIPV